jgi:hypothetical protein
VIVTSRNTALALVLAATLAGCNTYDYTQRTDRVGFSAGDAVKSNMAIQTIDPSKKSMNRTDGLGKDGNMPIVEVVVQDTPPGA